MTEEQELCKNCVENAEAEKRDPHYLATLPQPTNGNHKVLACPYCDGFVVELAQRER